ncbi:MAG: NAD(P)-binding domain-containing protein [Candidatus Odinarchaeota archaeon]
MIEKVGIIGVGHLASYLVEGLRKASENLEIYLSPRNVEKSAYLAERFNATVGSDNQEVADKADMIILSTRSEHAVQVAKDISFRSGQTVISVSILPIRALSKVIQPADVVRAMPISSAAINQSPTLLYPDNPKARALISLIGQVHVLQEESQFTPASVIAAYYGWIYALLGETIKWTAGTGVPQQIARTLVLETVRSAVNMSLDQPGKDLGEILATLVTKGGITDQGLKVLRERQGLVAWIEALEVVLRRLDDS